MAGGERKVVHIEITHDGDWLVVKAPYHPRLPEKFKSIGGQWNAKRGAWVFHTAHEDKVRQALRRVFGTDGAPVQTTTVRYTVTERDAREGELWLYGRKAVWRPGRDRPICTHPTVAVVSGGFPPRGGSRKYPEIGGAGTVLEIVDVPVTLLRDNADSRYP